MSNDHSDTVVNLLPDRAGPVDLLGQHLLAHHAVHHCHGPDIAEHRLVLAGQLPVPLRVSNNNNKKNNVIFTQCIIVSCQSTLS